MTRETRGTKTYCYRSRRVGGHVVKEYLGSGEYARAIIDIEDCERQWAAKQEQELWEAANPPGLREAERQAEGFCSTVEEHLRAILTDCGYQRHNRGEWRKKRTSMANVAKTKPAPMTREQKREYQDACRTIMLAQEGDASVKPEQIRQALTVLPRHKGRPLGDAVLEGFVRLIAGEDNLSRENLLMQIEQVQRDAAGPNPSPLESLLAERIAVCWIQVKLYEVLYSASMGKQNVASSLAHQKRIDLVNRRYISAIKALAQARKMQLPTMQIALPGSTQVNFAEQQINLAQAGASQVNR